MVRILLISLLLLSGTVQAQSVTINGTAGDYLGKQIELYRIEDYLSDKNVLISSTTVEADSTFSFNFTPKNIEKVIIKSNNNRGFLYVQPNGKYDIDFPGRNPYEPYKPSGNDIELGFYDLDSNDINYKILGFQRWVDYFVGRTFHLRNSRNDTLVQRYNESFDRFKTNVEKAYAADSSENSSFLKTYIKFTIAGMDNIANVAERNRYEKHDFYLKFNPVEYNNDVYMDYLISFYEKLVPQLPNKTNEAYYRGVLHSSPSMIMNALGTEYTLINRRIREIAMIQSLSENYYSKDYPQTNVIAILDSLVDHAMFDANKTLAKNIRERLTYLVPGGKAPNFVLAQEGKETLTLIGLRGKHVYLNFVDLKSKENMKELNLLQELQKKYSKYVRIISVYKDDVDIPSEHLEEIKNYNWEIYGISGSNSMWNSYRVEAFPQYVFIDGAGYVIASPALSPVPNGEYETIDQSFFQLKKAWEIEHSDGGEFYDRNH